MADQNDGTINSSGQIDSVRKCLSDLFDYPERQLQAAFAILIDLFREQAVNQQKLHKSFDALSEKQSEKERTISSCFDQIDKLSNDYQFFKKANDDILRNINILAEQIKEIAGLCFGATFIDNIDGPPESTITRNETMTPRRYYSDRQQYSGDLRQKFALNLDSSGRADPVGTALGSGGCTPVVSTRNEEIMSNEKTSDFQKAASISESGTSNASTKSGSDETATLLLKNIVSGKEPYHSDDANAIDSVRLGPSITTEVADITATDDHCSDFANSATVLPIALLRNKPDTVYHRIIAASAVDSDKLSNRVIVASAVESDKDSVTAEEDRHKSNLNKFNDTLTQAQNIENPSLIGHVDSNLTPQYQHEGIIQPTVMRNATNAVIDNQLLHDEDIDAPSESAEKFEEVLIPDVPKVEKRVELEVKYELERADKKNQEGLPASNLGARRTSLSFGSSKLSMDNALGYRVRRLEDLFSSFDAEVQLMKAINEKEMNTESTSDIEEACTKEEVSQLSLRLNSIEELLNNFISMNSSAIFATSSTESHGVEGKKSDASNTPTINSIIRINQEETIEYRGETKELLSEEVEVGDLARSPASTTNGRISDSTIIQDFPILTSNEQQTDDILRLVDVQKMLASQEEAFKCEIHSLSTQIDSLKEQLQEQTRRPSIQDILSSSETAGPEKLASVALLDDVCGRIDSFAASLAVVERKTNSKVALAELCDLIQLLTGEGPRDNDDAQVSFDIAVQSLSLFKKNFGSAMKLLHDKKADKKDLELSIRMVEDKLQNSLEELIKKNFASTEKVQLKLQRDVDDCRSLLDLFDSKLQFLASAANLDKSNSSFYSQVDAKIQESMHAVHASLEEAVTKKLEDIGALENELERVTSQLAEKPDEKQLRAMFHDLEQTLSARIGSGTTVQILLDSIRMEVMEKMTKSEVQALVKDMVSNARKDVKAHEDDSLMIGTAPFRCLGCDQIFSRGVHNKLANKKNHQALPSSGYLKKYNLLYLDPSSMTSSNNSTNENEINLPPMHNGLGFRRPKTSMVTSQQKRR